MQRLHAFILTTHRILGSLLSILFAIWFLSGLVMIYHSFPRVNKTDKWSKMENLKDFGNLPAWEEIQASIPAAERIKRITLNENLGQLVFYIQTDKGNYERTADFSERTTVNVTHIRQTVSKWNQSPIERIDTLYTLEQWIPFGALKQHFPIYKYYFADQDKHQLYVSSKTAEVLQYTNREERCWAWLGAIPHWIYFTSLRQDIDRWIAVVVTLSGIGSLFCLTGLYLGIRDIRLARRQQRLSPYKKWWYKWHHLVGTFFGVFVLTFCFSGMMSLVRVEDFGIRSRLDFNPHQFLNEMKVDSYLLDYRKVIQACPHPIRQFEWSQFGSIPLYQTQTDNGIITWDARQADSVKVLNLTATDVRQVLQDIHGEQSQIEIQWLTEQETYYTSRKKQLPLPVWKVQIKDSDASCYYIDPAHGTYRYVNRPARWQHWMYPAWHSLQIPGLVTRPWFWFLLMWFLMLGGTFVSISGCWLTIKYIQRKIKFWFHK